MLFVLFEKMLLSQKQSGKRAACGAMPPQALR
jgi:hypothetical protein